MCLTEHKNPLPGRSATEQKAPSSEFCQKGLAGETETTDIAERLPQNSLLNLK